MNYSSNPTDLKITDMRFVDIDGAPKRCTILRIDTNQGISGFGEVRDASSKTYALMLKSRILGENPCNVDKIFFYAFGGVYIIFFKFHTCIEYLNRNRVEVAGAFNGAVNGYGFCGIVYFVSVKRCRKSGN